MGSPFVRLNRWPRRRPDMAGGDDSWCLLVRPAAERNCQESEFVQCRSRRTLNPLARVTINHMGLLVLIGGYVLGNCPPLLTQLRQRALATSSVTVWFDRHLNRGARTIPAGA